MRQLIGLNVKAFIAELAVMATIALKVLMALNALMALMSLLALIAIVTLKANDYQMALIAALSLMTQIAYLPEQLL